MRTKTNLIGLVILSAVVALSLFVASRTQERVVPIAQATPGIARLNEQAVTTPDRSMPPTSEAHVAGRPEAYFDRELEIDATLEVEPRLCVLRGTVRGPAGRLIDDRQTRVVAVDESGREHGGRIDQGEYVVLDLHPGRYWVRAKGFESRVVGTEQQLTILDGESERRLDLIHAPAQVLEVSVVTRGGKAFDAYGDAWFHASVTVIATTEAPRTLYRGQPLARLGGIRDAAMGTSWGRLVFDSLDSVYVSLMIGQAVVLTEHVPTGVPSVTVTIDAETLTALGAGLRLRVVDGSTGAPIHGAWCDIPGSWRSTDTDGRAAYILCAPGSTQLRIRAAGYEPLKLEIDLPPSETTDLGQVTMRPSFRASGHVSGLNAGAWATISAKRVDSATGRTKAYDASMTIRYRHAFALDLAPAIYVLLAFGGDGRGTRSSANHLVDLRDGSLQDLSIELFPIARVLLRPDGPDWEGADFVVMDGAGLQRTQGTLRGSRPMTLWLPPDDYVLHVQRPGMPALEIPFRASGESVEVPFE